MLDFMRTWCYLIPMVFLVVRCDGLGPNRGREYSAVSMKKIQVPRGDNITLTCDADKCDPKNQIITWKFAEEIITINKKCTDLELTNVTNRLSGIYTCLLNNVISHKYQLEVTEPPPRVLSVTPTNHTWPQYSNIVVQCRTASRSRAPPNVYWFKQTSSSAGATSGVAGGAHNTPPAHVIPYDNRSYVRVSVDAGADQYVHSVPRERNVYVSKLNIRNATVRDSGVYACVALTEVGRDVNYFEVKVVTAAELPRVTETLSLLFLIPFSFALVPGIVWLCYTCCSHRRRKDKCKLMDAPSGDCATRIRMLRVGDGAAALPEPPQDVRFMPKKTVSVV